MVFFFKNTNKGIRMSENDAEHYRDKKICRFCQNNVESDKVRDHNHMTYK